jgi:FKBP-type peptidyl-prolyl cis-trans isomerase
MANLAVGESARALLPSDQAFGSDGNTKIPGYTPILVEIEVLAILK